jgi:hypothetical protein
MRTLSGRHKPDIDDWQHRVKGGLSHGHRLSGSCEETNLELPSFTFIHSGQHSHGND